MRTVASWCTKELDLRILEAIYFRQYPTNAENLSSLENTSGIPLKKLLGRAYYIRKRIGSYNPEHLNNYRFKYTNPKYLIESKVNKVPEEIYTPQVPITIVKVIGEKLIEVSSEVSTVKRSKVNSKSLLWLILYSLDIILFIIALLLLLKKEDILLQYLGIAIMGIVISFTISRLSYSTFTLRKRHGKNNI